MNSPGIDQGFGYDTNRISILRADGTLINYPLKTKTEVAEDIVNELVQGILSQGKLSN